MAERAAICFPRYGVFLERAGRTLALNPNTLVVAEVNASARTLLECLRQPSTIEDLLLELGRLLPQWGPAQVEEVRRLLVHWTTVGLLEDGACAAEPLRWCYEPAQNPPMELYASPTNQCNLHCVYCYNRTYRADSGRAARPALEPDAWLTVFRDAVSIGFKRVVFTGGEPLLYPHLRRLAEFCKQAGLQVHLLSNGTLIDREWAEWIARHVDLINVSLDSADEAANDRLRGAGSFAGATAALRRLVAAGAPQVYARPVVTTGVLESLPRYVNFCVRELGCRPSTPNLFIPSSLAEARPSGLMPDFDSYLAAVDEFTAQVEALTGRNPWADSNVEYACRCGVGSATISVDSFGDVYPCQAMHHPHLKAGSLREQSLAVLYRESPVLNRLRSLPLDAIPVCKDCPLVTVCGAGCRAIAWDLYGDLCAFNELFCPLYRRGNTDKVWHWIRYGGVSTPQDRRPPP